MECKYNLLEVKVAELEALCRKVVDSFILDRNMREAMAVSGIQPGDAVTLEPEQRKLSGLVNKDWLQKVEAERDAALDELELLRADQAELCFAHNETIRQWEERVRMLSEEREEFKARAEMSLCRANIAEERARKFKADCAEMFRKLQEG